MNSTTENNIWSKTFEDEVDYQFIQRVQSEVTQSCALPFTLPADRITANIITCAQLFWKECDFATEERYYIIENHDICKNNIMNKVVQLPQQILGVHGVYKINEGLKYGAMGDFSIERMMMSSYSMFGGVGTVGGGFVNGTTQGYTLSDMVISMYEVDTFNQNLNPTLTFNFNAQSSKLVILGDLGSSDILICCSVRCRIQDLYNDPYFFKLVVAYCKRNLSTTYGMYEFKLPGGVTINYDKLSEQADTEIEEVKEYFDKNRAVDYFFMPNTL